jgi:ribosomal protein S3
VLKHVEGWSYAQIGEALELPIDTVETRLVRARRLLREKLADASVSRVTIERAAKKANITIHTARPGIVIGKKGEDIEKLRIVVAKMMKLPVMDLRLNIAEIRKPELDAKLVSEGIAQQLEKRVMFRRAMKRAVTNTMRSGALGIKVRVSGRLNGAEIARTEWYREGRIPLHTFRRTSTTDCRKQRPPTASSASRCGSSRAKCSTRWKPRPRRPRRLKSRLWKSWLWKRRLRRSRPPSRRHKDRRP